MPAAETTLEHLLEQRDLKQHYSIYWNKGSDTAGRQTATLNEVLLQMNTGCLRKMTTVHLKKVLRHLSTGCLRNMTKVHKGVALAGVPCVLGSGVEEQVSHNSAFSPSPGAPTRNMQKHNKAEQEKRVAQLVPYELGPSRTPTQPISHLHRTHEIKSNQ